MDGANTKRGSRPSEPISLCGCQRRFYGGGAACQGRPLTVLGSHRRMGPPADRPTPQGRSRPESRLWDRGSRERTHLGCPGESGPGHKALPCSAMWASDRPWGDLCKSGRAGIQEAELDREMCYAIRSLRRSPGGNPITLSRRAFSELTSQVAIRIVLDDLGSSQSPEASRCSRCIGPSGV